MSKKLLHADQEDGKGKKDWKETVIQALGFYRNTPYVSEYQREANVRSSMFMSFVLMVLEVWMILRYIYRYFYLMPDKYDITVSSFFHYTRNYWTLLLVGLTMFLYGVFFLKKKVHFPKLSDVWITLFAGICLGFGVYVSFDDFQRGKMIICFLTMILYVACMLIWRPIISAVMLATLAYGFHELLENRALDKETGELIGINSGDNINYIMYIISLIMVAISIYNQRHREARKAEDLYISSLTDELTGLPNMHSFSESCEAYVKEVAAPGVNLVYLFFDIENFKTYNEQMGHVKGDRFLKRVGEIIGECFPGEPHARQSDDHFVVLTLEQEYEKRMEQVLEKVAQIRDYEGYIAMKVGGFKPRDLQLAPRLCVDKARYAVTFAKNRSDQYYSEYDEKMDAAFHQREYVLNNIDKAVKNDYIKVYYQPVMSSQNEHLDGCEALARWIDPEVGFLSPGSFIPILEESRQIHKLDSRIYEIVCQDLRRSLDQGLPIVPVSLNFSRLDFELMDAVEVLEGYASKYDIPRKYFHVEITESALTSDVEGLKREMDRFHALGYSIWLDDFGSGYSSMNVLKDFNFDLMKIDMVFLRGFHENEKAKVILRNIVRLAQEMGMMTLTEGVETREAVDFLEDIGCGRLQGYFFGKPMPYGDLYEKIGSGEYRVSEEEA